MVLAGSPVDLDDSALEELIHSCTDSSEMLVRLENQLCASFHGAKRAVVQGFSRSQNRTVYFPYHCSAPLTGSVLDKKPMGVTVDVCPRIVILAQDSKHFLHTIW